MIAHIAYCRRSDGHLGGVPKFGWYLERAVGARQFAWRDFPEWPRLDALPEHEKAELLGAWLWASGRLAGAEQIIADGFWANGLNAPQVTVVCHGTWAELQRRVGGVDPRLIAAQERAFKRFPVVAVSEAAARQLREHHGVEPAGVIPNGVDVQLFAAREHGPTGQTSRTGRTAPPRPVVLYAGRGFAKGEDVVREVAPLLPEFEVRFLDARIGEESAKFAAGDIFLFPSRHEGNSYALLEAMACGLPVVASPVGLLETVRDERLGVIVDSHDPVAYAEAVRRAWYRTGCQPVPPYDPRAWVLENATYERFATAWQRYLRLERAAC
jgi:glycosyltransferase involved in cell wall biosynthesis